jgi:hypothetical protein
MTFKTKHVLLVTAVLAWLAAPARARDEDRGEAVLLFKKAERHFAHHDFELALREFQQSYAISPRPLLLFDMGLAAYKLDLADEALAYLLSFMATVDEPTTASRDALRMIADLRRRDLLARPSPDPTVAAEPSVVAPPVTPAREATAAPATAPATLAPPATAPSFAAPLLTVAAKPAATRRPLVARGWFWGVLTTATLLAGGGVAVALTLGRPNRYPTPTGVAQPQ